MGGQTNNKTIIRDKISQRLQTNVTNITKNISKVMNETISKVATSMVQEASATAKQDITSANNFTVEGDFIIDGPGSTFKVEQNLEAASEAQAVMNIVQNNSSMHELANKATAELLQKAINENQIKQEAQQLAAIEAKTKQAKGPADMVESLTTMVSGMVSKITGGTNNTTEQQEKDIESSVMSEIRNENTQISDITNNLQSNIEQSFKQSSNAECKQMMDQKNTILYKGKVMVSNGGQANIIQKVNVRNMNKCIQSLDMGNKVVTSIGSGVASFIKQDASNKNTGDQSSKQEAKITKITEISDAIMNTIDNLVNKVADTLKISSGMVIIIVAVVVCCLIGLIALAMLGGKRKRRRQDDDNEQMGGFHLLLDSLESEFSLVGGTSVENYGNVYLWAIIAVLIYYVFGKSLPKSSALVISIICYIIYIGNKN